MKPNMHGASHLLIVACLVAYGGTSAGCTRSSRSNISADAAIYSDFEICTTSSFSARQGGGGPGIPGSQVLAEEGWRMVKIESNCDFYTIDGTSDGLGEAFHGSLDAELKREVETLLTLEQWGTLAKEYGRNLCDGPDELYTIGEWSTHVSPSCSSPLPMPPEFLRVSLVSELLRLLAPHGQAADGPVRYILVASVDTANDLYYQNAPRWPLAGDPVMVAITEQQASKDVVTANAASDADAAALRGLRSAFLQGSIGFRDSGFIPVEQPDGSRYQLFVRDVIE